MTEPIEVPARTTKLNKLYHDVGQLIALESATASPRIVIDGDIEVPWPDAVQEQIAARIKAKMGAIAAGIADLQDV